jgi:hypothetical protein
VRRRERQIRGQVITLSCERIIHYLDSFYDMFASSVFRLDMSYASNTDPVFCCYIAEMFLLIVQILRSMN